MSDIIARAENATQAALEPLKCDQRSTKDLLIGVGLTVGVMLFSILFYGLCHLIINKTRQGKRAPQDLEKGRRDGAAGRGRQMEEESDSEDEVEAQDTGVVRRTSL